MRKTINRVGEVGYNNHGTKMIIIEYNSATDITIEFQDERKYKVFHVLYSNFKNGMIRNPYDKTTYGVGYLGEGKYKISENKNRTLAGVAWDSMMERCYSSKFKEKHPNYIDSYVCEEWHCFQNFAEWFYNNYYKINGQRMEVENNILLKNNKKYCPEYSIISPQRINNLFVKMNNSKDRGKYCIGVTYNKQRNKYVGQYSYIDINGKYKRVSKDFKTEEEAFEFYKKNKEEYIKRVANEYKGLIPENLYNAMQEYKIEITD